MVTSFFFEYFETAMPRPRGDGRTVDDLSVDLGPGHEAEPGLADDDGLGRIAHALAGGGPGVEQRDLALDEQRLRLLRLEEQHARRVVRHGPHHLVDAPDARRGVDQRLHVLVENTGRRRRKSAVPPVVQNPLADGLIGTRRREELPVASVPAPAVEELGRLVPLLPGLGRSEVVLYFALNFFLLSARSKATLFQYMMWMSPSYGMLTSLPW